MIKNININKLIESNVVANLTGDLAIIIKYDPFMMRGDSEDKIMVEPEMDYVELILDKDMNPIFMDEKYITRNRIKSYKEILKNARYYLIGQRDEYNSSIEYGLYDIVDITDNLNFDRAYEKAAMINVSSYRNIFKDTVDIERLKRIDAEKAEELKLYFDVIKIAMDVIEYGKETVVKDLYTLYYEDDSDFLNNILYVKNGEIELDKRKDIHISKTDGCIFSDIVILDGKIINMVNLKDLHLTAYLKNEDTFILTYNDKKTPHTPEIEVSVKDALSLERNVEIKNSLIKYVKSIKVEE